MTRRYEDTETRGGEDSQNQSYPGVVVASSPPHLLASSWLLAVGLILLIAWPRLTALNQYLIVDEADRWRWAKDFVAALSRGDLAGTRVGDGYPGIVPVWAETIWILLEAARRSLLEGRWIGEAGLYLIFHEWDRPAFLFQQRLPIVLLNTILALAIVWAVWRLFGRRVALISGILIALDPFYLSDSRVNRAEAVITGLMTLSMLALIFYQRQPRWRYIIISGVLAGLSFLTKIQALAMLPAVFFIGLLIVKRMKAEGERTKISSLTPQPSAFIWFCLTWASAACLTWFLLWPAMWVIPVETLTLVYDYTTRKVGAEGVNLFFMGQTYANADPGPIFYPFALLMRLTPLALVGLAFYASRITYQVLRIKFGRTENYSPPPDPFVTSGSFILLIYILVYAVAMSLGSHKQDRYLMPIFPSLNILAAMGLIYLWDWLKKKVVGEKPTPYYLLPTTYYLGLALFAGLILIQLATALPHHPYYYSYFNPLLGGGQTAVRTMRVGWGEGMDQVGAYLAAKPNSRNLVVASRFTHNMLGFRGDLVSLLPDGRWTQADYIVLYIQQVQRRQEPSPGFIDYFQTRTPEKIITIGGIDYAWIYPIPFTTPANPNTSLVLYWAALLGYRWEETGQLRLFWENMSGPRDRQLVARLRGDTTKTGWATCSPDPAFVAQAQTAGAYVESLCAPALAGLPPGTYTVEFGLVPTLAEGAQREPKIFTFPEGWQAATITAAGEVLDTPERQRLDAVAAEMVSPHASRLDRIYEGRLRLIAYQLDPPSPHPGQTVKLTLYWQRVKEVEEPVRLTVQLADSRSLPLGRIDAGLSPHNGWLLGQVIPTVHEFELAADLTAPLAAQVEVTLQNEAEVLLRPTTAAREPLEASIARFTIAPEHWPEPVEGRPVEVNWQNGLALRGYKLWPEAARPGENLTVSLFWQADQAVAENYVVFVHLLDETGQIKAQNDDLPRAGAYPTP
ncbi:MAG TPA: glycosyltransferase family 39 protein, partial [Anaerolineae bacterium]|nr:glycosyltransferase family 39 protein [Anaerolineae bacterium]